MPSFFQPGRARDVAYSATRDLARGEDLRARVEAMWQRYEQVCGDDAAHFLKDARERFHARTWEMYLACSLMDRGFALIRPPRSGPDLRVQLADRNLWIEATTTESGTGPDAAREWPADGEMHPVEHEARMLRYAAAIRCKRRQWGNFVRRGVVSQSEPYVVAVNGGRLPVADIEGPVPDVVRTVLGLGDAQYAWDRATRSFGPPQFPSRSAIHKQSGAPVRLDFFASKECEAISGVMFSMLPIWNAPDRLGEDLQFVHNPYARNPLDRGTFRFGCEWWFDTEAKTVNWEAWKYAPSE